MHSLVQVQALSMFLDVGAMSFSAVRKVVNNTFTAFLIREMLDQQAIFTNMQFSAGEPAVTAMTSLPNIKEACKSVIGIKNTGSITAAFEKKGRGKLTYSHRQYTKTETKCICHPLQKSVAFLTTCRAAIVCWVCENLCPFSIVHDQGFRILIKTGRPEYYLPSPSTVSHDVRLVFANKRSKADG